MDEVPTAEQPAAPAPTLPAEPSLPPAPPLPPAPVGIPPLIPDNAETRRILGGAPLPMKIGRASSPGSVPATPAPEPGPVPAAAAPLDLRPTFSGTPADPELQALVSQARLELGKAIATIAHLETVMPALLDAIDRKAAAALTQEAFDVTEAAAFHMDLSAALEKLRR